MIKTDNNSISSVYDEATVIGKIFKGTLKVYESWRKLIASGVPLLTIKSKGEDLINYTITGNSVQNGTPTPEAPIEVESVGDKTSNLIPYPYSDKTLTTAGLTWTVNDDRTVSCNGTPTGYSAFMIMRKKEITGGKTYAFNLGLDGEFENIALNITLFDSNGTSLSAIDLSSRYNRTALLTDVLVEVPENAKYINISVKRINNNVETYAKFLPKLEEGTSTTDYEPYGYKIPVRITGKNLLDYTEPLTVTDKNFNGRLYSATSNKNGDIFVSVPSGQRITVSADIDATNAGGDNNAVSLTLTYEDGTTYTNNYWSSNVVKVPVGAKERAHTSFVATKNVKQITFTCHAFNATNGGTTIFSNFQIEIGELSDYELYIEPVTTNIYIGEPLRKIGDYEDYIDFEKKKIVRNINAIIFNGTEAIDVPGSTMKNFTPFRFLAVRTTGKYPYLCNYLEYSALEYSENDKECLGIFSNTINGQMFFVISNNRIALNDITAFKNWLAELYSKGTPLIVYYVLTTQNDKETIELPNVTTFKGTTIIEVDTKIQPSNLEVTYKGKK